MKNIIIFSEESDHTSSEILRWIHYFNYKNIIMINTDDSKFGISCINSDSLVIKTSFNCHEIFKGDLVWFRRAASIKMHLVDANKYLIDFDYNLKVFNNLERQTIVDSVYYWILNNCKTIANPFKSSSSRIDTLIKAERLGIRTPEWLVCDSKKRLKKFLVDKKILFKKLLIILTLMINLLENLTISTRN